MSAPGGKGSAPRPIPNPEKFSENWDRIFGKPKRRVVTVSWQADLDKLEDEQECQPLLDILKQAAKDGKQ